MTLNTDRLSKATSRKEDMTVGVQNKLPRVEPGNLFNQTQSPSLNGISETVQPSVSSDVFSGTTIPSKDAYNYAKSVGGSMLEEQQQTIKNTFANLINETYSNINQGISNAVDLFSGIKQNFGGGITTTFSKSAQNLLQEGAYVSQIGNKLEQGIAKRLGTEDDVARVKKEGEEGYETVKGWADKTANFLEEAQKGYWGDTLLQGEGAKGYVNELSYQLGQMTPSIAAGLLGGKTATFLTLLPFMSQEAYDRYSNIDGVSDTQVFLASNIVGILNSLVETVFGLENLASGGRKITPKFLKKPVLNYLSKFGVEYGVNITGETLEEVIQAINEDIGAFLLGEESEFESVWDMLTSSSYWKNMYGETIVPTAKISAGLLGLPTHISTMHEIKKEQTIDKVLEDLDKGITENLEDVDKRATDINKAMEDIFTRDSMLYDLAQDEETYEEFLEDAKEYADEELLQSIWNTVKGKPKVETGMQKLKLFKELISNTKDELSDLFEEITYDEEEDIREEELAYKYPEYYDYITKEKEGITNKLNELNSRIESIKETDIFNKDNDIQKVVDEIKTSLSDLEEYIYDIEEDIREEELAYKYPEYYDYITKEKEDINNKLDKLNNIIIDKLKELEGDLEYDLEYDEEEDIREEELAYKYPEYYDYITRENEDIEYEEEEGLEEKVTGEEITQTERDMDLITEFINQAEEHFNQKLAQEQNKTLEDIRREQQEAKAIELTESEIQKVNDALTNLAINVAATSGLSIPKFENGRYSRPDILNTVQQGTIGEGVKPEATRKETERQYYKTIEQLDTARRQRNALITLINSLNNSLNKGQQASKEDVDMVNNAMGGQLIGKNILLSDLNNGNLVGAAFKARRMANDWAKVIKKLKAKADRQAWKYIYRLHAESKDNQLIGFSTFSLKHKLKTKPTEAKYINMIQSALKKMSDIFNLDMSKVFEGCHVIFLDYGGSSNKQAWGSMEGFVDGNGTPVIPISLNYVGWKESTVIHELMHGLDFVYQYRNGGVSFVENNSLFYSARFLYTLDSELPGLYRKLLNNMTYGEGRKGYWTKPTEVMSRIFQEYYEYYVLNQTNTVNDTWHWEDITIVKEAVNELTDLFRKEFGRNPVINGTETLEQYNRKIDETVDKFNSEDTWQFLEMIEKVGKMLKDIRKEMDEANTVEELLKDDTLFSELDFQWRMITKMGQDFTDVMLGTKGGLYDLEKEVNTYEQIKKEAEEYVKNFDNKMSELKEEQKKLAGKEGIKKAKIKKLLEGITYPFRYAFSGEMDRIYNISPRLAGSLYEMEAMTGIDITKYSKGIRQFINKYKGLNKAQKNELHKLVIDFGDETSDTVLGREKLIAFADKYGLRKELDQVFDLLKLLRDEAIAAGLKVGEKENYFPRNVNDYEGLIKYLDNMIQEGKGDVDYKPELELLSRLQGYVDDESLTDEEKQRRIRNVLEDLSGKFNKKVSVRSAHQKARTITGTKDWGEGLLKFYDTPDVALAKYIEDIVTKIERARFFGRGVGLEGINSIYNKANSLGIMVNEDIKEAIRQYILGEKEAISNILDLVLGQGYDYDTAGEKIGELLGFVNTVYKQDTEQSITSIIKNGIEKGWISPDKLNELRSLLKSYFDSKKSAGAIQSIQSLTSLLFLSDFRNTLTQLADIGFSQSKRFSVIKPAAKAILNKNGINTDVLGIEDPREELKSDDKISNFTSFLLEAIGFKRVDIGLKGLFLNTAFETFHEQANSKIRSRALKTRLKSLWGEERGKLIFDIYKSGETPKKDGKIDMDRTIPVLIDLASELGNTQPIYKSSRTQLYNDIPRLRPVYSLRTYPLRVLNMISYGAGRVFKNNVDAGFSKVTAGVNAARYTVFTLGILTIYEVIAGEFKNLYDALTYLVGIDDDDDEWKETILYTWLTKGYKEAGKKIKEEFWDNLSQTFFTSRYAKMAYNISGFSGWLAENIMPAVFDTVFDIAELSFWFINLIAGKNVVSVSNVKHPASLSEKIPGVGDLIYKSWGKEYAKEHKDVEKIKEKKGKGENKSSNKYNINF